MDAIAKGHGLYPQLPNVCYRLQILGIGGDEVVHAFLDMMYAEAPYTVITRAMHIHPTVAEFMPTLLGKLEPLA